MAKMIPNKDMLAYLKGNDSSTRKQYLAMVRFYLDGWDAHRVAETFGYTASTVYTIAREFRTKLGNADGDPFFREILLGRKKLNREGEIAQIIIAFRKKNMSVPDIKIALNSQGFEVAERTITAILNDNGFSRLPRRGRDSREETLTEAARSNSLPAPKSVLINKLPADFSTQLAGILCFLPIIRSFGINKLISKSTYPKTQRMGRLHSILCFIALKLLNVDRYSIDDSWCMDRGGGLFAGLNVLPKTAWFSSYSSATTREMNVAFLKGLNEIWSELGLLSDTVNLDFTAIPYWGDDDSFENNWSGKRSKALASMQAVIAQDPDNGILCYGDTTIRHENQNKVVLEFLDFYRSDSKSGKRLEYLVFDSKFTTYENLAELEHRGIKFITIQRRSKGLEEKIASLPGDQWKDIAVEKANNKHRTVTVAQSSTVLPKTNLKVRQIFIKGTHRIKPAVIITNDESASPKVIVRKYALRWLVEKEIAEQIHFFHLNRNSSGIVVKVDFDLTMTILAHNLYRILASKLDGYGHCEAKTIYEKFVDNAGEVVISEKTITVRLKRRRSLPLLNEAMAEFEEMSYPWLNGRSLVFEASSTT
jgi:transposase